MVRIEHPAIVYSNPKRFLRRMSTFNNRIIIQWPTSRSGDAWFLVLYFSNVPDTRSRNSYKSTCTKKLNVWPAFVRKIFFYC